MYMEMFFLSKKVFFYERKFKKDEGAGRAGIKVLSAPA